MISLLVVLLIIAVAATVFGVLALRRSRARREQHTAGPVDPFHTGDQDSLRGDPRALKAGDIVEIRGLTYTVRGTLRMSEGGWTWSEHLLDDAKGNQLWLGVEEDPDLILSAWTPLPDSELRPGPATIEHDGRTFRSDESGTAEFRSEATTGLDDSGTVRYHDYEGPEGALLSFEAYGDAEWEAAVGETLSRYAVTIYPVSPQ